MRTTAEGTIIELEVRDLIALNPERISIDQFAGRTVAQVVEVEGRISHDQQYVLVFDDGCTSQFIRLQDRSRDISVDVLLKAGLVTNEQLKALEKEAREKTEREAKIEALIKERRELIFTLDRRIAGNRTYRNNAKRIRAIELALEELGYNFLN